MCLSVLIYLFEDAACLIKDPLENKNSSSCKSDQMELGSQIGVCLGVLLVFLMVVADVNLDTGQAAALVLALAAALDPLRPGFRRSRFKSLLVVRILLLFSDASCL